MLNGLAKTYWIVVGTLIVAGLALGYGGRWAGAPMAETIGGAMFWLGLLMVVILLFLSWLGGGLNG